MNYEEEDSIFDTDSEEVIEEDFHERRINYYAYAYAVGFVKVGGTILVLCIVARCSPYKGC